MRFVKEYLLLAIISFIAFIIFFSCKKETYDFNKFSTKVDIQAGLAAPLAYGEIFIEDLIDFNDTLQALADGSILLSYNIDTLFSLDVSEIISINDEDVGEPIHDEYGVGVLDLNDVHYIKTVTLGELSENLEYPTTREAIDSSANYGTDFPPIPGQHGGVYPDTNDSYVYVTFSEGVFKFRVVNNLPATIDTLQVCTYDIGTFTHDWEFTNLSPGEVAEDSMPIDGMTFYNVVNFCIDRIVTDGSTESADLDNNNISMSIIMERLKVINGRADVERPEPTDSIVDQKIEIEGKDEIELTTLILKTGQISYEVHNQIGEQITIYIDFPYTYLSGSKVEKYIILDSLQSEIGIIDLAGSETDLTMGDTTYNRFSVRYTVTVDSIRKYITFDSSDAVSYDFSFENVDFEEVWGYFGKDTTIEDSTFNFDIGDEEFFNKCEGKFRLSEPELNISYLNSLGVSVDFDILISAIIEDEYFDVVGSRTVPAPNNPGESVSGDLVFDENDGLDDLLVFPPPSQINYNVEALANPGPINHDNFITDKSRMYVGLNMEIPLSLQSDRFAYLDTIPLEFPEQIDVEFASIAFDITNDFPFNVRLQIIPWDSVGNIEYPAVIDTLLLQASKTDNEGALTEPSTLTTALEAKSADFENMKLSDHIEIRASVDTKDETGKAKSVKVLSTYGVRFTVYFKGAVRYEGYIPTGDNNNE